MVKKPSLNIVVPVYNEEKELVDSIKTLQAYLVNNFSSFDWEVSIVDNASSDATWEKAQELARTMLKVKAVHLDEKGRGRAVKYAWNRAKTDYMAYMDVDLSTDLKHLLPLVQALERGYDVGIGSRNATGSRVYGRSMLRTITSKGYILLVKLFFWVHFSDAQCGFKAVRREIVDTLLPKIIDNEWFFDSELLITAEKSGYRIYEEPVTWIDNQGSTVRVWKTALGDLSGLWRLWLTRPWKRLKYDTS